MKKVFMTLGSDFIQVLSDSLALTQTDEIRSYNEQHLHVTVYPDLQGTNTSDRLPAIVYKGTNFWNFLVAFLCIMPLPKMGRFKKGKTIDPSVFPIKVGPISKGKQNSIASP